MDLAEIDNYRLRQMPETLKPAYKQALARRSRKKAILLMCRECCGYSAQEVRKCTDNGCPLYAYRLGG